MSANIHPSAIISRDAELGAGVRVGPFAIVGDGCVIGEGSTIAAHAVLEQNVRLANNVKVGVGSVLGGDPQDLKFKGEETTVDVGENSVIREYSTINRGTAESMRTTIGRGCFIMSYVHLAHDCHIGDGVIISNATQLAGHVTVEEKAIGNTALSEVAPASRRTFRLT
jgi:UDP-N-acetylglucosamine acyltransferase